MNLTFAWVALIYGAAVFVWRKLSADGLRWRVAALFYLLVLAFLFRPLTQRFVDVPADYTTRIIPWSAYAVPDPGANTEINDVILQMVPWSHEVRQAWRSLQAPLWNRNAGGGYPLLANGQSAALSIFRLLALPLPLGYSFTCEAALKILVALTFAFLYARRRYGELAAILTAISFGFSTFIIVWLHFPHASVAVFLPALFYGIDRVVQRPAFPQYLFLSAVFAVLLLNGHPESAAHSMFAVILYAAFLLIARPEARSIRVLGVLTGAGMTALLLASPFVLPFMEALPRSQRMDWLRSQPIDSVIPRHEWKVIIPYFHVNFFGTIRENNIWGPGIAEVVSGYSGILAFSAWFGLLFHVLHRRRWRDVDCFWVLASALILPITLGWWPFADLFHRLPLFSLAANGRLRFVLCWFFAVMAGAVVDLAMRNDRKPLALSAAAGLILLAGTFAVMDFPWISAEHHAIATGLLKVGVLLTAVVAVQLAGRRRTVALSLMTIMALCDLWAFGRPWNSVIPARELYPMTPLIQFLQRRQNHPRPGELAPFRIAATGPTFFPNSAGMFGLEDIRSHDPMAYGKFIGAMRVFTGYSSFDYFGVVKNFEDPYIDYLNVRYLITGPGEPYQSDRFVLVYYGADGRVYENRAALPRFYAARNVINEFDDRERFHRILGNRDWANTVILEKIHTSLFAKVRGDLLTPHPPGSPLATVRFLRWTPDSFDLDINAPRWTLIVGSQPVWPGWRVWSGEQQLVVIEVNNAFLGFVVPPGHSRVSVRYRPLSFVAGAWISLGTILLLSGWGVVIWRRRLAGYR
ncbi:MAG: YfhO family protein [Acidobacteriota bacterium]